MDIDIDIKLMVVLQKFNLTLLNTLGKNIEKLGLTSNEFTILAHLNKHKVEKTQKLGEIALITSGTITYIVNNLIKKGYVTKHKDEKDKRIFWINITTDGNKKYNEVFSEHLILLNKIFKDFSYYEKQNLINTLKYFGKNINQK